MPKRVFSPRSLLPTGLDPAAHRRHALITGASSGLGAALARQLAEQRAVLSLTGRNEERLDAIRAECCENGAVAQTYKCDVTDAAAMKSCVLEADARCPVDLVIANAGIGGRDVLAPANGETAAQAFAIFATNTLGVFNTIAPLIERLIHRRRGQIVIISSMMAYRGLADAPVYAASKAAVRAYGQGLRQLLAPHGVSVLIACPGFVATPMSRSLPFATPFMVPADAAAARILTAVDRGKSEVAFPWQLHMAVRAANLLPSWAVDPLMRAGHTRLHP